MTRGGDITRAGGARMSRRTFTVVALLVTLAVAGVLSLQASASPDGLEAVAERLGFADAARDPATAEGPLADYETVGVGDTRLSRGVAGVVGVLVTLGVTAGLALLVRRRRPATDPES